MLVCLVGSLGLILFFILGVLSMVGSFGCFSYWGSGLFFGFMLDDVSILCIFMLFSCGWVALFYAGHYFLGSRDGVLLFMLIVWFIVVMGALMGSYSFVCTLVCWEYLGLVSFFLILFYSNSVSFRAAVITLVVSRLGDVSFFIVVAWFLNWLGVSLGVLGLCLLLIVLTKSACYPFISWLLEAMRAPTPVSSLVHSSTLVAAGIWFLLRYGVAFSGLVLGVLLFISLLTVVISGICAVYFEDLKKIVALSTCNNISWCILFFVSGDYYLSLMLLISHGVCKCFLFMSVGDLMLSSGGSQSSVGVFMVRYDGVFSVVVLVVLVLSLCGFPFIGVYFIKHLFLGGNLYIVNYGYLFCLSVGVFLSYLYSFRLLLVLFMGGSGLFFGYLSSFWVIGWFCLLGGFLNYVGSLLFVENLGFSFVGSMWILGLQFLGFLFGGLFFVGWRLSGIWESILWGGDAMVSGCYSMFEVVSCLFVLVVYRWELYFLDVVKGLSKMVSVGHFVFSLNFFVCGIGLVFLMFLLFF